MADTLTTQAATLATIPASSVIATDDAGAAGHVQVVKLALSADGSATPISADANGLEVQGAGTAGTPAGGVVSVQGVASGTVIPVDGSGVTQPVSGTVAVTNAGLTELAAAIDTELQVDVVGALPAGTNNIGDVDVLTLPALPAGTNNIGDVDVLTLPADPLGANADAASTAGGTGSLSAKLRLMTTQLDAIQTSVQLLDNAIAGNELQVDIVSGAGSGGTALADDAAFTAATTSFTPVGGIVTADSVDSGDGGAFAMLANRQQKITLYDSAGVELAVGGGTQYTEDAAAAANPVGNALVVVRDDARGGSLTTTDGDNVALRGTNSGEVYVKHVDSVAVTHAALTELAAAIDTELQVDVVGALPAGDNNIGNVDIVSSALPTGASTLAEQQTQTTALQLIDDTVATLGTSTYTETTTKGIVIGAVRRDADTTLAGTTNEVAPLQVDANGYLKVEIFDGGGSHTVDNNGTFAVQVDGSALTALQLIDDPVQVLGTDTYTEATSKGMTIGAVRRDADTTLVNTTNEFGPLQMDANGRLKVEAFSGETLPVSLTSTTVTGTVSVTQSGTWDEVGINDSGNSITVDNGGTFAVQVDGAALTALQLIDDTIKTLGTDTYTEASTKGSVIAAVRRDADTTLVDTTNEIGPLQMDANGRLKVEAFSGETLPVSLASVPSHAVTNAGVFAVQVDGSALTALQLLDDTIKVDDATFTPGTTSVSMAGFQADEQSIDSVDEGDAGAARMTLDRKVITQPQPHSAGGLLIFRSLDLDETEEDVKTSAGQVYTLWFTNTATSTRWLKFYNATAANVTVGSTTPVLTLGLPGNTSDDISGVFSSTMGFEFGTAISVAATTGFADADTGAPGNNEVLVNIGYK